MLYSSGFLRDPLILIHPERHHNHIDSHQISKFAFTRAKLLIFIS
jgi:hypothetical protein